MDTPQPENTSLEPTPGDQYRAYLLRLWRADETDGAEWRASLEAVGTRERRGFARLEHLIAFLTREFDG